MGKKQHYVPQFFLRNFSDINQKSIGVYRFNEKRFIKNASIKDITYRNHLYDEDDSVEAFLAEEERKWKEILDVFMGRNVSHGQHRLYGYSDSLYATTNTIPVVAFVDLERSEQIKLFMDINENQKAVPKSLRVTLNADMLWESSDLSEQRQALRSKVAQMLGEEPTSPLHSAPYAPTGNPRNCIKKYVIRQKDKTAG